MTLSTKWIPMRPSSLELDMLKIVRPYGYSCSKLLIAERAISPLSEV
jgi:hypothetical protein